MRRYWLIVAVAVALLCAGVAAYFAHRNSELRAALDVTRKKADKFDTHCRTVRAIVADEVRGLERTGDSQDTRRALDRLFEQLSSPDVGITDCMTTPRGVDGKLVLCWTSYDRACMVSIAKATLATLPKL